MGAIVPPKADAVEDGLVVPSGKLKEGMSGRECLSPESECWFDNGGENERIGEVDGGIMYADQSDCHVLVAAGGAKSLPEAEG